MSGHPAARGEIQLLLQTGGQKQATAGRQSRGKGLHHTPSCCRDAHMGTPTDTAPWGGSQIYPAARTDLQLQLWHDPFPLPGGKAELSSGRHPGLVLPGTKLTKERACRARWWQLRVAKPSRPAWQLWGMKFGVFSANRRTQPRWEDALGLRLTPGWSLPGAGMPAPGVCGEGGSSTAAPRREQ